MRFIRTAAAMVIIVIILMPVAFSAAQAEYISQNNTITMGGACPTVSYTSNNASMIGKWVFIHNTKTWSANMGLHDLEQTSSTSKHSVITYTSPYSNSNYIDAGIVFTMTPANASVNCTISVNGIPNNSTATLSFDKNGVARYTGFSGIPLTNHQVDINIILKIRYTTTVTVAEQPKLSFVFTMYDQSTSADFVWNPTAI